MQSLQFVQERGSPEDYRAYQKNMAQVPGRLFLLVMDPIYGQHPSLAPHDAPQYFRERWKAAKDSEEAADSE